MGWMDFRSPARSSPKGPETQPPRRHRKAKRGEQEARGGVFQGLRERLASGAPPLLPGPSLLTPSTVLLRGGELEASDSFLKNRILKVSSLQCFRGGG